MAAVAISVERHSIAGGVLPAKVAEFFGSLNGNNRRAISAVAAASLQQFFREYIRSIAPRNHKTALSFNPAAKPTGHLEKAARNTLATGTADGVTVTVTSPGITRAFHDLDIRAKGKMLTIPARPSPEAYGKRAREVALVEPLFLVKAASGAFLATSTKPRTSREGGARIPTPTRPTRPKRRRIDLTPRKSDIRPVFWLRAAVRVPQKRNILPSDAAIIRAARKGYATGIEERKRALGL